MKLSEDTTVPVLEGWVNITEAAELLGITRQHSYKLARTRSYKSLHRIGTSPAFVISTKEIQERLEKKQADEQAKKVAAEAKAAEAQS